MVKGATVSSWGTSSTGGYGFYIGLGLGTTEMSDADLLFCYYNFTNKATDKFECYD